MTHPETFTGREDAGVSGTVAAATVPDPGSCEASTNRDAFIDWLGELLWHWQGETSISSDTLARQIMGIWDAQQKRASQFLAPLLPDAQAMLRGLETSLGRTEIPSPRGCLGKHQGE